MMWLLHCNPVDKLAKLWWVYMWGVVKECDVNVSKSRSIDSSCQIAQVLANSLIFEFPESKESNVFPWQRQANRCQVVCGGKEMEQKSLKLGHLGQGICKCFWREPNIEISWSWRSTRPVERKRISGIVGMATLLKCRLWRHGPHWKALERVSSMSSTHRRTRSSSSKNGLSSADNFSRNDFVMVRLIELTWLDYLSVATILSSSLGTSGLDAGDSPYSMTIGMVGQRYMVSSTGIPNVQNSWRWRECWDANTINCHLQHICTSLGKFHGEELR